MTNVAAIILSAKAPLEVQQLDIYTPGPNELLIRNEVIAFNQIEAKIAKLAAIPMQYPAVLGSTFGGVIEAIGSQVTSFRIGDRVVVSKRFGVKGNQYGAFQRYVVVNDIMVSKIPADIELAVPASIMMNLTCVVGLFSGRIGLDRPPVDGSRSLVKKEKILVYGGSSSFGSLSVQYLFQAGYNVVTTSSPKGHDFVSSLGASAIFDHTRELNVFRADLVANGPYDIVVDMISTPDTIKVTSEVLASQHGGVLYTTQPAFGKETLPSTVQRVFEPWSDSLYEDANRHLQEWVVNTYLPEGIRNGAVRPLPIEKVAGGLNSINDVLKRMHEGISGLKLVVDPRE